VALEDASDHGGAGSSVYHVADFAVTKYLITNAHYRRFTQDSDGYTNPQWWTYSPEAARWHTDRPKPMGPAFEGDNMPRTRASWFESMAFCNWLSARLHSLHHAADNPATWCVRLPTERQWQRAAIGDTGWPYPWGEQLDETRGNYGNHVGRTTPVGAYLAGASPYGVMDMMGNLWEWCSTRWPTDSEDVNGYSYRHARGGAWNISAPRHLRATDRGGLRPAWSAERLWISMRLLLPMTYFALIYHVVDDFVVKRQPFRPTHLALAKEAELRGELILGGALGDPPDRALLVFRAPDRSVAEAFARSDPYVLKGLVTRWEVQPWSVVGAAYEPPA
jgi:uncharacterized protein YciI